MALQSSHCRPLLIVADGDKLVSVGAAPSRLSDNFTKLGEFLADLTERFRVQVEKGDAESLNVRKIIVSSGLYNCYLYRPYISQSISLGVAGERKRYRPNSSDISDNGKLLRQLRQFSAASFFLNLTKT